MPLKISVPATSANLGSGFDVLGLALALYATLTVDIVDHPVFIDIDPRFANDDNLVLQAYRFTCQQEGFPIQALSLKIDSDIPIARGLGSSSSLIVAGVVAAFALNHQPIETQKLLSYANAIEGHPDNIAPAIVGGCISSLVDASGKVDVIRHPIDPSLHFTLLIPDFELSTATSRAVLPKTISLHDASRAASKVVTLLNGLKTGDLEQIAIGCDDHLHQPYRFPLIADVPLIQKRLADQGIQALYLSGAGPTLAVITKEPLTLDLKGCKAHWTLLPLELDTTGVHLTHA